MRIPQLDGRLRAAALLCEKGRRTADIGCDHGLLAAHLITEGISPMVLATDLNTAPLKSAQRLFDRLQLTAAAHCRCGSGFDPFVPEDGLTQFVCAGLSGVTIAGLVARGLAEQPWIFAPDNRFIFVPATKPEVLRGELCRMGFELLQEQPSTAAGKSYVAVLAQYTGRRREPRLEFCVRGLLTPDTPEGRACMEAAATQLCKQSAGQEKALADRGFQLAAEMRAKISAALKAMERGEEQ